MSRANSRRIIAKIKALQAKRVSAGATEAEAESAAALAAKLMAQYSIDDAAIAAAAIDRNLLPIKGIGMHAAKSHPVVYVGPGVAHISGCEIYLSPKGLYVVGDEVGRVMAGYLFDMTRNVIDSAWAAERECRRERCAGYWQRHIGEPMPAHLDAETQELLRGLGVAFDRVARRSFGLGMAMRIAERMVQMPAARPVDKAIVDEVMADKKQSDAPRKSRGRHDSGALGAGLQAGSDVPISMGVDGASEAPRQIAARARP